MKLDECFYHAAALAGYPKMDSLKSLLNDCFESQQSPLSEILEDDLIDESLFLSEIAKKLHYPWLEKISGLADLSLRNRIPASVALRFHILPLKEENGVLEILTYNPFDLAMHQILSKLVQSPLSCIMTTRKQIFAALREFYGVGAETFDNIMEERDFPDDYSGMTSDVNVVDGDDPEASVVKFVNQIIREGLKDRATDIHFEPLNEDLRVRFRIDGVLHDVPVPAKIRLLQSSVISRLKIMSHLDIAEKRLPQDGRINLEFQGNPIDVRVATIPSVTGESVSLRLLSQEGFDFAGLGLDATDEINIRELLSLPNGIILLTGPTGCGKSTSLYTFLSSINTSQRRIVTVEDPVEYKLQGVIQIAVKPDIGLTFAAGLRHILRSDPNIVMVGEIRDVETAEIAIRAALTGHLVFSTLHTNDAIGGITRLVDMGVEPFLVASAVRAFLAQRLVRVLCPQCSIPASYPSDYLRSIGFPKENESGIRKACGCENCKNTGYIGRTAIFEICKVSPRIGDMIIQGKPASVLQETAMNEGMNPLRLSGWKKVSEGKECKGKHPLKKLYASPPHNKKRMMFNPISA